VTNDELAVKLAQMEGFLQGVGESVKRIEGAIDKVIAIDRTVAEHAIRFESQGREIRDLGHDIKSCQNQHTLAAELQGKRTDKLEDDANQVRGVLLAMKIFSGVVAALLTVCAGWVYNRAELNYTTNNAQAYEIANLRRELTQLMKEQGK
jgi:hypothetical protein